MKTLTWHWFTAISIISSYSSLSIFELCRTQAFWFRWCSNIGETTSSRHSKIAGIHWGTTVSWTTLSIPLPLHAPCTQFHWGTRSKWTRNTSCKRRSGESSSRKWRSPNVWPCRGWSWFLLGRGSTFLYNL